MNTEYTALVGLLSQLGAVRAQAAELREAKRQMIEEVQATLLFKALDEATKEADETQTELEECIRLAALDFPPGEELPDQITIKKFTVVTITSNVLDAIMWCKQNFLPALKLDTKVFEKAAKDGNIPAELATVTTERRAQITTKL